MMKKNLLLSQKVGNCLNLNLKMYFPCKFFFFFLMFNIFTDQMKFSIVMAYIIFIG